MVTQFQILETSPVLMNETDKKSRNKLIIFNANNLSEINLSADFTCNIFPLIPVFLWSHGMVALNGHT